jgi:NADP-dependent 3-hydroxy acid dehydrogenase YdfG
VRHARRRLRRPDRGDRGDQRGDDQNIQRVAVITGASSGIGEAIARRLAADGWHCVLLARRPDLLERLAAELGGEFEVCDVSDRAAVERVAAAVTARHPRVDLLVNNAGVAARASFLDAEPERIEQVVKTNFLGSVWALRAFLPALEAAQPAYVVNIVSVSGAVVFAPSGPYTASKHAQLAFSRAVAAQLRGRGISVYSINPGFVETEGFPNRTVLANSIMRRFVIDAEDVAEHVVGMLGGRRSETFIPWWYRPVAIVHGLFPATVSRLLVRAGYRRTETGST